MKYSYFCGGKKNSRRDSSEGRLLPGRPAVWRVDLNCLLLCFLGQAREGTRAHRRCFRMRTAVYSRTVAGSMQLPRRYGASPRLLQALTSPVIPTVSSPAQPALTSSAQFTCTTSHYTAWERDKVMISVCLSVCVPAASDKNSKVQPLPSKLGVWMWWIHVLCRYIVTVLWHYHSHPDKKINGQDAMRTVASTSMVR